MSAYPLSPALSGHTEATSTENAARILLALFVFGGSFVMFEPSPYEILFIPTLLLFVLAGLRVHVSSFPMIVLLVLFNIGGVLALPQAIRYENTVQYVIISVFMAANAVFFAALMTTHTLARFEVLKRAYIWSAVIAAFLAIIGYFDVAGLSETLTRYNRAKALFKDPNVFAPFLVLPLVLLLQDMLLGSIRKIIAALPFYLVILFGAFLSFSRAAWTHVVLSSALMVFFLLIFSSTTRLRLRVAFVSFFGAALLAAGLAAVITIPEVRSVFEERASLSQSYDVQDGGRFSNQARGLRYIVDRPLGLGPYGFSRIFPSDPHNVYLNAFFAYGWLGGVSYFALIVLTWAMGFWALFLRSPYRLPLGAVMATFSILTLEGIIIDTDHWRHFFLLLGLVWGFVAAVMKWRQTNPAPISEQSYTRRTTTG